MCYDVVTNDTENNEIIELILKVNQARGENNLNDTLTIINNPRMDKAYEKSASTPGIVTLTGSYLGLFNSKEQRKRGVDQEFASKYANLRVHIPD